jgi:predicted TIM-barrel fold metal-dependent hydrolase
VREAGFRGVYLPGAVHDPDLPPYHDRSFDPFWAACEELGLVLVLHAAFGAEQGRVLGMLRRKQALKDELVARNPEFASLDLSTLTAGELLELGGGVPENSMQRFGASAHLAARRALTELILGGVFDRHPALRAVLIELRADWIPATLAHLDARVAAHSLGLELAPSEYFHRNWWVAPSSPRPTEVAMRHEIGIDRFLFATDYPHPEGTWPDTAAWLRAAFGDVPQDELRMILGENAVACLGIDPAPLREAARRVGPRPSDVIGRRTDVAPELIDAFGKRSGFANPAEVVDRSAIDGWLTPDLVGTR